MNTVLPQYLIETLGWTLIHWLWQGLAIAAILAVAWKAFAKVSANKRYLIGCAGLTAMMVMPMLTFRVLSSRWVEPVELAAVKAERVDIAQLGTIEMPIVENDAPVIEEAAAPVIEIGFRERVSSAIEANAGFIVYSWLIGVFGFCLWHLGGWRQLQKLRRTMVKPVGKHLVDKMNKLSCAIGVNRAVSLMESAMAGGPMVVGWLKPMILLPASALTGLQPEQIEAILAHELAHIKRCDYLVNIIQTAVEIVGFYNPAIWWVSAKIRQERENCCDDVAVALTGDKVSYVRALTTMEEVRSGYKLAVAGSGGSLFDRAKRLLTKDADISSEKSLLTSVVAMLLIMALLIPTVWALSSEKLEDGEEITTQQLQQLVEDFFKHNYRDITARKTIEWGEPAVDAEGNMSIRYKYEATIWNKDKIIENKVWTFDKQGKFISVRKVGAEDIYSLAGAKALVEDFFANNYRDITSRETIDWGQPVKQENSNVSIQYKYKATIWNKDKIIDNKIFTFDKAGKFVSAEKVKGYPQKPDKEFSGVESNDGFQNAVEENLPAAEGRNAKLFDIDTGKWGTKSDFGDNDRETHKWVRENGLDLLAVFEKGHFGLLAFDVAVLPVKNSDWPQLSAKDIIENKLLDQMEANKITPMMQTEVPATYLFRTRENSIGILQITGLRDDSKSVNIRYKKVQGANSMNSSGQIVSQVSNDKQTDKNSQQQSQSAKTALISDKVVDAGMESRFALMKGKAPEISVTVFPIIMSEKPYKNVAEVVALMLEKADVNNIDVPDEAFSPAADSNIWQICSSFEAFVREKSIDTDYALFGQYVGTAQSGVKEVRCVVVDKAGNRVWVDRQTPDDDDFKRIKPNNPMLCSHLLVERLRTALGLLEQAGENSATGKWAKHWQKDSGTPATSEHAEMAKRLAIMRRNFRDAELAIFPTLVNGKPSKASADNIREILSNRQLCPAGKVSEEILLEIAGTSNQQKRLWDLARKFKEYIQGHKPKADYTLYADYLIDATKGVGGVHFVICDRNGEWVIVDFQNEYQSDFKSISPKTISDCDSLVIKRIQNYLDGSVAEDGNKVLSIVKPEVIEAANDQTRVVAVEDSQTVVNAKGQDLLKKMAEVNRYWLIGPGSDIQQYSYDFNLYLDVRRDESPKKYSYDISNPSKASQTIKQGVYYYSALHKLAKEPEAACVTKIEKHGSMLKIDYSFYEPIKCGVGNGISKIYLGSFTRRIKYGSLWIDSEKNIPIRIKSWDEPDDKSANYCEESFSDYVSVGGSDYVPLKVEINSGEMHFDFRFRVSEPGLWLFDRSSYKLNRWQLPLVASLSNIKINNKPIEVVSMTDSEIALQVERGQSAIDMHIFSYSLKSFAKDHGSQYPDNLGQLKDVEDSFGVLPWVLKNVEYLGKGKTVNDSGDVVIAYDKTMLAENPQGSNALYNDGSVRFKKKEDK
ncbi:MAG: M56 family metallopeptidase [Planctomycetes bacterium]|nr:M56 family metallopeptidase [Planctomycetota bacterium]